MPNALLKLLVKDKPLYSIYFTAEKYVKKGNETSEERETKLQQMSDRLIAENSERDSTETRTNQHVKLAVETRGEITLQQRSTNQCEWLAVETPDERELRFNRVSCREQHMLPQLPLFQ